jgi:hypothetical protein
MPASLKEIQRDAVEYDTTAAHITRKYTIKSVTQINPNQ